MPKKIILSKEQILAAQRVTQSNLQAARRLRVDYRTYKKWAESYEEELGSGVSLFEKHKATSAGIPRYSNRKLKDIPAEEILDGRVDGTMWPVNEVKEKLLQQGYLIHECGGCGYKERRIGDYRMPILLAFKDGNKKNFLKDNLDMLCYNCYFLQVGDIFTDKDHDHIEGHIPLEEVSDEANFEVDEYMLKRLKELGLSDEEDDDPDGLNEIISRR